MSFFKLVHWSLKQEFNLGISRPDLRLAPVFGSASSRAPETIPFEGDYSSTGAAFDLIVNYSGDSKYQAAFDAAEATWEGLIPRYINGQQGGNPVFSLTISAQMTAIDGAGNVLGSAGPRRVGYDDDGFALATTGEMQFDTADFTDDTPFFRDVILHEMGHVLGIGTLWEVNNVYDPNGPTSIDPDTSETVGHYTGAEGLAGYQAEFNRPGATFVPIEKGGGSGTADGHWDEGNGGGATGRISQIQNEDMNGEIMTGWANGSLYISNVTRGSLRDIGYDVALLPVPEPGSMILLLSGAVMMTGRRKRR